MKDLDTRAALVTGGAQGIGRAIAEAFLQRKVKVLIADVNENQGKETEKELKEKYGESQVLFKKCDVTSQLEFENAVLEAKQSFGYLDILVNNAGIGGKDWEKLVDINIKGVFRGTMLAFKHLEDKNKLKGGTVINIASTAGLVKFWPGSAYGATKHAVVSWTRNWGDENNVKETKVNVCAICPGGVDTPLIADIDKQVKSPEGLKIIRKFITDNKLQPSVIGEAAIKILTDGKPGSVLRVTHDEGSKYVEFPI